MPGAAMPAVEVPLMSDNVKGALLMSAAMAGFTINDVFMKSLSDDIPQSQAIFLRGALGERCRAEGLLTPITTLSIRRELRRRRPPRAPVWQHD